ncbi:MAG TPA: glycosyl transferase [Cyanobacteria bacterium UBA11149]|nr:glycosyl transferase [Cyanobacteria bacterium UBA11367]HBE58463.1 glycosyl transferase [Cyanobacteria bacterium UBA11366]HBK62748.1 glycosyl transferase [Cyanobacteria bacterium UBA11166]HBR73490.1 glycosyl transferase [Cyanobacteria bacterium UBA11159]HBS71823.1 glycosyl transferase [Cyanobacteria bacterium UBA11153]HBW92029.1 glycosyl transferase [Cyanobacteria bacterium UBA11149]HCA94249.1 glycosyl transferase [Cyanobacteria bacterium UBA9226]
MNKVDFTVAIPTFNGAKRLPQVMEKLKSQINTENISWEIIIIDNNSQDNTAQLIQEYQNNWLHPYPLKYYCEAHQGAAYARQRAIDEAGGELVGFLDDDVIPDSDWVAQAYNFGHEYPKAGAYGGKIHGDFEVDPPENFARIKSFLALRDRGNQPHLYQPETLSMPPSAALVVRKQAWLENVPKKMALVGRLYGEMVAGEDYEVLMYIYLGGWEIWYQPQMKSHHKIPQKRLEKDYLLALSKGAGLCVCSLRLVGSKIWQKPLIIMRITLGSLKRLIGHILKYRGQVKNDLVAACEREFLLSSLLSPLYLFRRYFESKT